MIARTSRRGFLKQSASFAATAPWISKRRTDKPNLLVLWTDEQRADTMAAYGNNNIHTPNLNRLADECVVVRNAYVSQPVCTPSRSTVMTGLWPHQNGCTQNNNPLSKDTDCLPELLDDSDYRTGYFGKWHLGDEIFAQHGFEEWKGIEDGYRKYYGKERNLDSRSDYWHFLNELGHRPSVKDGLYGRSYAARLPLAHSKPKFLEMQTCDFLQRNQNDPFTLYVNFLEPHMPFFGPLDSEHDPADVEIPRNFNDPLEENEPLRYRLLREKFRQNGFEGHDLMSEAGWRGLIAKYWGLVTQVDLCVGGILRTLENLGLADNTIVVYTSDHGDMMGAHQLLAKTVMYEESVRVPWLMRIPQQGGKKQLIKQRLSHIDLVPTLLELMGREVPDTLAGKSLVSSLKSNHISDDPVFIEWNPATRGKTPHSIASVSNEEIKQVHNAYTRTVITQDGWKLCWSDKDKSQLFNLNEDAGETANLYYDPNQEKRISRLKKLIHQWQKQNKDIVSL
jgi:arylsulfatase